MKPVNQQERTKAFYNFLLFFVITVGVIVTTLIFSFQVPFAENEQLLEEKTRIDNESDFLASFENDVQETTNLLYSLDTLRNTTSTDAEIDIKIKNLYDKLLQKKDSLSVKNLCTSILDNLSNYHKAKIEQRTKDDSQTTIADLRGEIAQWKTAWTNCVNGKTSVPPNTK